MSKRGKILRDPATGPGLLMVEGQQYSFSLLGTWRSEAPPRPGLSVDVEFDTQGKIISIIAVPESQVAKEQAEIALVAAKEKGAALASTMVAKFGLPSLIAGGLLIIGWFLLTYVSVEMPFMGKLEFTFWQVLGYLNSGNSLEGMERHGGPGAGFYGFIAIVALAGPFVHRFWKDKRAVLGGLLPLVFMIFIAIMLRGALHNAMGASVDGPLGDMQKQAQDEMMKAVSYGLGMYVSGVVSLYFAAVAAKQYLLTRAIDTEAPAKSNRAVA
jgi:hypothetical protein